MTWHIGVYSEICKRARKCSGNCCIATRTSSLGPEWVKGEHGIDPLGASLVPQKAAEVVALARFSALCH